MPKIQSNKKYYRERLICIYVFIFFNIIWKLNFIHLNREEMSKSGVISLKKDPIEGRRVLKNKMDGILLVL